MKKGLTIVVCALALIFLVSSVRAELMISPLQPEYNYGDTLSFSVQLVSGSATGGFLDVELVCAEGDVLEIYRSPESLTAGQTRTVPLSVRLDPSLIGLRTGRCFIRAAYGAESQSSQPFEVSRNVIVTLDAHTGIYNPSERIQFKGTARKQTSAPVNGFIQVSILGMNISDVGSITNGSFVVNLTLPPSMSATTHTVRFYAYERSSESEGVTNEGVSEQTIRIRQVPATNDIALGTTSVSPETSLSYTPVLYDQAGQAINEELTISLVDPSGTVAWKKVVRAHESQTIEILRNQTPGRWKIISKSSTIEGSTTFTVEEHEAATFALLNDTLIVTNVGNVPYRQPVEVLLNTYREVKDLDLAVGEVRRIKLYGPRGTYSVSVSDGKETFALGSATVKPSGLMTGHAIGLPENFLSEGYQWIIWVCVIIIVGGLTAPYFLRVRKRKFIGSTPSPAALARAPSRPVQPKTVLASHAIMQGQRQTTAIVALRIKNMADLSKPGSTAPDTIQKALHAAKQGGCKIYVDGDYRMLLFAPLLTKQTDNLIPALKAAQQIQAAFEAHNKKFVDRINYGLGVHLGDLVVEQTGTDVKFSSLGTSTLTAKKAAQMAQNEIFMTELVARKSIGPVKTEQVSGFEFHRLLKIIDRTDHTQFIDSFKKRQNWK